MEVEHFPLEVFGHPSVYVEQLERVLSKVVSLLKRGSNVHLVGGPDMVSCACLTGLVRRLYNEWPTDSVVSEALDICRFAEAETVASIVLSEDISYAG